MKFTCIIGSILLTIFKGYGQTESSNYELKVNGKNLMAMNYIVNVVYKPNGPTDELFLAPDFSYGVDFQWDCDNQNDCNQNFVRDFNVIGNMGFNVLRIVGLAPKYVKGSGLQLFEYYHDASVNTRNKLITINPADPSDVPMIQIFNMIDKILELSGQTTSNPMKVIFLLGGEMHEMDDTETQAWNDYFNAISLHIAASSYKDQLFAYDLVNEPVYSQKIPQYSKKVICNLVTNWYNIIKGNDPDHLITLGSEGIPGIYSFDPGLLNVDFLSIHLYPEFMENEDPGIPSNQDKAHIRFANHLRWFDKNCKTPWIIGETGFASRNIPQSSVKSNGVHGTYSDLDNYVNFSLNATCNCGGSGYSWWTVQDRFYLNTSIHNWYGMIERGYIMDNNHEKGAASNNFRNFKFDNSGICPSDYVNTNDMTKLYYNTNSLPLNSNQISGTITDQNSSKVADAVIFIKYKVGLDGDKNEIFEQYYTFTDINGIFKGNLFTYNTYNTNFNPELNLVKASAAGMELKTWSVSQGNLFNFTGSVSLNSIYSEIYYNNEVINNGQYKLFKGYKSAIVSNTSIKTGAQAIAIANKEIQLLEGFEADAGSDFSAYLTYVPYECDDLMSLRVLPTPSKEKSVYLINNNKINYLQNTVESVEVSFKKSDIVLNLFPNPTNDYLTVDLTKDSQKQIIKSIQLVDLFGQIIYINNDEGYSRQIELTAIPKGIYFIKANSEDRYYVSKFTIN